MARFLDGNTYDPGMSGSTTYMAPRVRKVLMEAPPPKPVPAPLFVALLSECDQLTNDAVIVAPEPEAMVETPVQVDPEVMVEHQPHTIELSQVSSHQPPLLKPTAKARKRRKRSGR